MDWRDADVMAVTLTDREWKGARGKAIRDQHTDGDGARHFFWVLQEYGDERIVFAPGHLDGGKAVESPGIALAEAALQIPTLTAWRSGNRYGGVRVSEPSSRLYVGVDGRLERSTRELDREQPDRYRRAGRSIRVVDEPWTMDDSHDLIERVADVELVRDQRSRAPYSVSAKLPDVATADRVAEAAGELHRARMAERKRRDREFKELSNRRP
jgi:hypothetical protein